MPDPLRCPSCETPFHADRVDLRRGIAACDRCGSVTRLDDVAPADTPTARPVVTRPTGFTVEEHAGVLAVRWRWWSPMYIYMAFFCVLWDGFILFWYSSVVFGPNLKNGGGDWFFVLFPLGHVAAGMWMTYATLCGWVNRTTVAAGHGLLRVRHGPLPWPGSRDHDAAHLRTLFVREGEARQNGNAAAYDLLARTDDGGEVKLLGGLDAKEKALFLERTIEDHLGLTHEPVAGAVS